ncbi:hypothetical protein B0H19DRAFT_862436, partial [Mycena capillaripes]
SILTVTIEYLFGRFKGCFPSLREMGPHGEIQETYKAIKALMILHNIAIDLKDKLNDRWCIDKDPDDQDDEND